jgi:hypothetical protein
MHFVTANLPTQRANSTFHESIETNGAALAESHPTARLFSVAQSQSGHF